MYHTQVNVVQPPDAASIHAKANIDTAAIWVNINVCMNTDGAYSG